jgi:cell division transport system permease protein
MSKSFENYQKRKLKGSYFTVTLSMTLVLFVIGGLGLVVLKSTTLSDYFKEQMAMTIYLKDEVPQANIDKFIASLDQEPYSKEVVFVSKEEAARTFAKEVGEDFISFVGKNPLRNNLDLYLEAEYVSVVAMDQIEKELKENNFVFEIRYDRPLVEIMNKNIQKVSKYTAVVCLFFMLVSVLLINSSLRLSIYSKRFTIKTMQMVGATKGFIRAPFIWKNIKLGFVAALLANAFLALIIWKADLRFPELLLIKEKEMLITVAVGLFVIGFLISSLSTFLATTRFLNLRSEELYN